MILVGLCTFVLRRLLLWLLVILEDDLHFTNASASLGSFRTPVTVPAGGVGRFFYCPSSPLPEDHSDLCHVLPSFILLFVEAVFGVEVDARLRLEAFPIDLRFIVVRPNAPIVHH